MASILRWIVGVGVIWFAVTFGLTAYLAAIPNQGSSSPELTTVLTALLAWGSQLGHFIAPVVQIALIVMILIAAAERFGITQKNREWGGFFGALGAANNVQAFIAVTIIGALVVGVLGGVQNVDVLKDLALVVLGFYFGTRRRQGEVEDAVAAGIASANLPPSPTANSTQPPALHAQ